MPRVRELEELQKHTINLYKGDYARLQAMYPDVGANIVIRKLIRKHVNKAMEPKEVQIEDLEI